MLDAKEYMIQFQDEVAQELFCKNYDDLNKKQQGKVDRQLDGEYVDLLAAIADEGK